MGTLPFPPKRTGHQRPAHLAVEAISNGENGGLILLSHGSKDASPNNLLIVSISFFVTEKKKSHYTCFGSMERQLNVLETRKRL